MTEQFSNSTSITLKRRILSLKGICVGIVTGLVAVGFRLCLEQAEKLREFILFFSQSHSFYFFVIPSLIFVFCIWLTLSVFLKIAPEASGSGIPHLKGCLKGFYLFRAWRVLLVKFIGGILGIGSGLALGREGPTIQMGGAIGKILGNSLCSLEIERKLLIAAGAGAGLSAAFNAPLAGIFFVLEELENNFNRLGFVTAFTACISADIVCRLLIGQLPVFHIEISYYPEIGLIPLFIILGVILGFVGLFFNKSLIGFLDYFKKFDRSKKILLGVILGIFCGIIGFKFPEILGTGTNLMKNVLNKQVGPYYMLMFLLIRFFFTLVSYSTGAPGGIFAPLLLIGALCGSFFGYAVSMIIPDVSINFSVWGVLGMAGCFSAIVRAPITGVILIMEMTNQYYMLLPLIIVSIVSYSIPEFFKEAPIYGALLERDLQQKRMKDLQDK
jgi:chloride channel protein, CIC family